jgi:sugar lactone lactonase YvrE
VATVGESSRHRARPSVGRLLFLLAAALVSSAIGYAIARPNSPPAPRSTIRPDVIAAFRHLLGPPESAKELAPYVEAVNARLATAIASGAVQTSSDDANLTPDGTASVSTIKVVSPTVATVNFAISDGGDNAYPQRFVGDVVATGGRWKISWATVCMLVEAESYVCPNPPTTLLGAVPLPHSLSAENETAHQEPDLLRPQALAVEPDGDLLIVDTDRDQILRWQPDGHLSIFAGTGQPGLGGVGGPAVDARLPGYFGAELAVSRDGTVFVTGGNACGLLVITPSGLLQRRLTQLCNVSGVTLSGSGTLYLTDGTGVYQASPSGALTELARSQYPPSPNAVTGMPSATGFSPSLLAFEGNGDLDIYSNGPRAIWRLTPDSQLTDLGIAYAEGMATAPDGTVLLAGHGGSIVRVTAHGVAVDIDLLSAKISGYGVPGMRGGFDPNGIAVAPDGTIFVDTFSGNGWTDATSVAAFPPHGAPRQLAISTPVLDTLPAPNAPAFPAAEYPAPVASSGAGLSSCPSAKGLQPFARAPSRPCVSAPRDSTPTSRASGATSTHPTVHGGAASSTTGPAAAMTTTPTP